ncbi:hypothetical protein HII31_06866 [Pseudocercospora fuligena]|uniref:Uncharacterized protein n=1 Tax=Pseudocercospora fuligena TaxID=685502 RepID=A0A8H6RG16_9PEZI|nr:hypothetical protein HII31_06866 [Pseudocercospora fuligena]
MSEGSYNTTTTHIASTPGTALTQSSAPSPQSPASIASAGTATITNAANATRSSTSSSTTSAPSTCCYLYPRGVGINTWWSSSVDITVATVITTWLKYNNTMIPGNSTTKTVINASTIYGDHAVPSVEYTAIPISPTMTTTMDQCSAWDDNLSCIAPFTTVYTYSAYSTNWYNTSDIFSGVPNSLLPPEAVLYGRTSIDQTSVATFPSQDLTIQSPTPYYLYSAIDVLTSKECMATMTYTSLTTTIRATRSGEVTYVSTVVPMTTVTAFEGSSPINAGFSGDIYINQTVAMPFPDGDYSDFNFTTWADGVTIGPAPGPVDAYMFLLPDDFPAYLDSIPYVKSDYPDIGRCTNFAGDGEPTVHVQVNQLTDTSHVTQTINGNLNTPTTADAGTTTESATPLSPHTEETNTGLIEPTSTPDGPSDADAGTTTEDLSAGVSAFIPRTEETNTALTEPTSTPDGPSDDENVQPGSEPQPSPDETRAATIPDLVSIIQQATPSPGGQETQGLDEQPIGTTSALVGDIIASVIGLVPQESNVQQDVTRVDAATQVQQQAQSTPTPAVITVGESAVTANDASESVVGSQTAAPGGPAITEGGNTISIAPAATAVVINGNTSPIEQPQAQAQQQTAAPQITIGDSVVTADGFSNFVVGSQTLAPGGAAITVDDNTLSLAQSAEAIVINGVTSEFQQPQAQQTPAPQITFAGSIITANSASAFVVGSQTLTPAGPAITVDGTTLSLAPLGSALVVDGQSSDIAVPVGAPVTIAGEAATPIASDAFVLPNGEALSAGGTAVVLDGTTLSLAPSGNVVVNGITSPVPISGNAITSAADEQSALILQGTTLLAGSSAVISGTTYSLPSTGGGIFINGQSTSLLAASPGSPITLGNGIAATPTMAPELVIGGQTLVAGGSALTVSGTTYSASGSQVVVVASGRTVTEDMEDIATDIVISSSGSRRTSSTPARSAAASTSSTENSPAETTSSSDASQVMSSSAFVVAMLVACLLC